MTLPVPPARLLLLLLGRSAAVAAEQHWLLLLLLAASTCQHQQATVLSRGCGMQQAHQLACQLELLLLQHRHRA
jgi:hypothetical protein